MLHIYIYISIHVAHTNNYCYYDNNMPLTNYMYQPKQYALPICSEVLLNHDHYFPTNIHNMHPMACPSGRGMGCSSLIQGLTCVTAIIPVVFLFYFCNIFLQGKTFSHWLFYHVALCTHYFNTHKIHEIH